MTHQRNLQVQTKGGVHPDRKHLFTSHRTIFPPNFFYLRVLGEILPNSRLFLFSPHLVFCASGTFSGNNQRKHDSFWSNAHKRAGSPRLFRFLKPGAEGSLIHPEPARSVLQRSPPIRRRELEPSDFRPRFKRCHRQKKQKKNCLSDKTATASDRFLVSRVSSAGLAMRQFLLSRGKKETRDGS